MSFYESYVNIAHFNIHSYFAHNQFHKNYVYGYSPNCNVRAQC